MIQLIEPLEVIANSNLRIKFDIVPFPRNIKSLRVGLEDNPQIDQRLFPFLYDELNAYSQHPLIHISPANRFGTLSYEWDEKYVSDIRVENRAYMIQPGVLVLSIGDDMFAMHSKRNSWPKNVKYEKVSINAYIERLAAIDGGFLFDF